MRNRGKYTCPLVDGVRVVLVADIYPNRQALDANRRRAVELELQQPDAEYSLISATPVSSRARFASRSRKAAIAAATLRGCQP